MLALVWLLYWAFNLVLRSIAPLITPILEDLNISYTQMGLILGSWPLTYIVVALIGGAIIDRWGIRKSLFLGIVTSLVGLFFILVPAFTMLFMTLALSVIVILRSMAAIAFSLDVRLLGGKYWWVYMLLSVTGIFFSFALLLSHLLQESMVNEWTGLSLLTVGVYNAFLGMRLRRLKGISKLFSDELLAKYRDVRQEIRRELERLEHGERLDA